MVLDRPVESQWDFATSASTSPESATKKGSALKTKGKLVGGDEGFIRDTIIFPLVLVCCKLC